MLPTYTYMAGCNTHCMCSMMQRSIAYYRLERDTIILPAIRPAHV